MNVIHVNDSNKNKQLHSRRIIGFQNCPKITRILRKPGVKIHLSNAEPIALTKQSFTLLGCMYSCIIIIHQPTPHQPTPHQPTPFISPPLTQQWLYYYYTSAHPLTSPPPSSAHPLHQPTPSPNNGCIIIIHQPTPSPAHPLHQPTPSPNNGCIIIIHQPTPSPAPPFTSPPPHQPTPSPNNAWRAFVSPSSSSERSHRYADVSG